MRNIKIKLILAALVTSMLLSACNLSSTQNQTPDAAQIEAIAAGTVAARLTQFYVQTLVAQVTQQAIGSFTPTITLTPQFTFTPTVTSTPVVTNTAVPPTATPIPPTFTPVPIPCNRASFVADVTIPDGTSFIAGSSFVKTWRIMNTGSCNWTTSYTIFFISGSSMSAPSAVAFPRTVKPGETVDLSISMVAPTTAGNFTGNWMLNTPNGNAFGVGQSGGIPLYVNIAVATLPTAKDTSTIYDFVNNYCSGQWRTNAGYISCPTGSYDYKNGTISRTYTPILESGAVDDEGALITIPSYGGDGFIQGQFPKLLIHSGDHFKATLFCSINMTNCSVTYELLYMESGSGSVVSLGAWDKTYDGTYIQADIDLSALDGKEVIFFLKVSSKGDPTNDFAQWMAARVAHP